VAHRISATAARAVLAEIQRISDARAEKDASLSDSDFARSVLASLMGGLEARLPSKEWNKIDVFRARRATEKT
jgi:hypothetical protein